MLSAGETSRVELCRFIGLRFGNSEIGCGRIERVNNGQLGNEWEPSAMDEMGHEHLAGAGVGLFVGAFECNASLGADGHSELQQCQP